MTSENRGDAGCFQAVGCQTTSTPFNSSLTLPEYTSNLFGRVLTTRQRLRITPSPSLPQALRCRLGPARGLGHHHDFTWPPIYRVLLHAEKAQARWTLSPMSPQRASPFMCAESCPSPDAETVQAPSVMVATLDALIPLLVTSLWRRPFLEGFAKRRRQGTRGEAPLGGET